MGVSAENLDAALRLSREVVDTYLREGPSESELDDERHAWAGSFRVALATNSGTARQILRYLIEGRPMEDLDRLPEAILSCRRGECIEAMRRHIRPKDLVIAVAGTLEDGSS